MKLESLAALVNGAIAFDSPEESKPAEAEDTFGLYEDLAHSQRGVIIKLELPSGAGLTADSTPLMYQGLEVGQLTKLDLNPGGKVTGEMTVDPSVVTLLRKIPASNYVTRNYPSAMRISAPCSRAKPSNWCRAMVSHARNLSLCLARKPCCMNLMF